ncbi:hypothetical protein DFH09DRAFT_1168807 [Mycena vulgaris]|nr:hypothetical protein DFH09DRAFT_1168807 [Mycena vulgaris]
MDSQLTLVDPSPPVSLTFNADSMTNATLTINNTTPAYTISTDSRGGTTEIRAAGTDEVLARIVRKGILPDTITFPNLNGGKAVRLTKWLKSATLPNGVPVCIIETAVGKCFLRKYRLYRLALFTEHDLDTPVAYLMRPTVATPIGMVLMLEPGTESFRAQIIAAFIIQEQKTRAEEEALRATWDPEKRVYKAAIYGPSHSHGGGTS